MKNHFKIVLLGILLAISFSCEKPITSVSEVIEANLKATSNGVNWDDFKTKKSTFNLKTIIGGNTISDVEKVLSVKLPYLQKTVTTTNDTLSGVILTNKDGSSTVKFDKGIFFGINTMPKEPVRISPVLGLKENLEEFSLEDSIWNDKPVYKLVKEGGNDSPKEEYVFDKESKFLIAYISDNRYGKSTMTYSDYKDVDGYMLPFKEEVNIPKAGYKLEATYSSIRANPTFSSNFFELDKAWSGFAKGQNIPEFNLPTLNNPNISISSKDIQAKVTLIDFWATWCKPCIEELPNIKTVYNEYKNKGFEVVSISIDKEIERAKNYTTKNPFPWKYSLFSEGEFNSDLAKRFQLVTLPKPILIDQEGKIIAMDADLRGEKLEEALTKTFKGEE